MTTNEESNGGRDENPSLEEIPLSLDAMLDILAHRQRRYLLEYLADAPDDSGSFEQVTRHVVEQASVRDGEQPNRNEIEVSIQHKHLPRLVDAGLVEYDARSKTIRYHPNERLERLLEAVEEFETE